MKVFHHDDLDGRCAAAIALQWNPEAECIEINYNQPFPGRGMSIERGETIYILDYSIRPGEMVGLLETTDNVIWIDHHKTAIEKFADYPDPIPGIRRTDRSGAWLTWEWFNPTLRDTPPEVVRLVDDWDMWTHEKNTNGLRTRHFVAGMKAHNTAPASGTWIFLFGADGDSKDVLEMIVDAGELLTHYEARQNAEYLKAFGHAFRFEDHNCYACNRGITNFKLFDSVDDPTIDIFIPFVWDGFKWTVSLYSKTVDVSEIAKKYGGGGHTNAAGFVCDALPWKESNV